MSEDASSPHEAEIAARRLAAMIEAHGITERDLAKRNHGPALAGVVASRTFKRMPTWYNALSVGVAAYCGVKVRGIRTPDRTFGVEFQGYEVDVSIASLFLDYLTGVLERGIRTVHRKGLGRGGGHAYRLGFAFEMQARLQAIIDERNAAGAGTALVETKAQLIEQAFGAQKTAAYEGGITDRLAFELGATAARQTSLAKQISGG